MGCSIWGEVCFYVHHCLYDHYRPEWPDFVRGIEAVLSEMYFDYNQEQIHRSVQMIKDYIHGNVLETEWFGGKEEEKNGEAEKSATPAATKTEELPNWDAYMKARLGSVGGQMSMQLIEYAKDVTLTDEEFYHPLLVQLERAVSEEMTLVNDFLTFRKEVAENDYKFSKMRHAFPVLVNQGAKVLEVKRKVHLPISKFDPLLSQD